MNLYIPKSFDKGDMSRNIGIYRCLFSPKSPHLLLSVDDLSGVERVGQNAADGVLIPVAVPFGFQTALVQQINNLAAAIAVLQVQMVALPDDSSFLLIDGQVEGRK